MYKSNIEELRKNHLSIVIYVYGGKAARKIGQGNRTVYLVSCDGRELTCVTTTGEKHCVSLKDVGLKGVNDVKGRSVEFQLDDNTGHLLVMSGESVLDYGPWLKYERKVVKPIDTVDVLDEFDTVV